MTEKDAIIVSTLQYAYELIGELETGTKDFADAYQEVKDQIDALSQN